MLCVKVSLIERVRVSIGVAYARLHFRGNKDRVIRFTDSMARSRTALILLPKELPDASAVRWILRYLKDRYQDGKLVVFAKNTMASQIEGDLAQEILTYDDHDLNLWFIPRARLRHILKKSTFDVAIDLSTDFELPNAFLCRESQALLRVSFAKERGDGFYNFQVQTNSKENVTVAYRNLIKCLEMF